MDENKVIEAIKMLRKEIQECKEGLGFYCNNSWYTGLLQRKIEVCNTAIEALEKQLPKKVEYEDGCNNNGFARYRMAKCPTCERWYNSNDEIVYCSNCGQRFDWS